MSLQLGNNLIDGSAITRIMPVGDEARCTMSQILDWFSISMIVGDDCVSYLRGDLVQAGGQSNDVFPAGVISHKDQNGISRHGLHWILLNATKIIRPSRDEL